MQNQMQNYEKKMQEDKRKRQKTILTQSKDRVRKRHEKVLREYERLISVPQQGKTAVVEYLCSKFKYKAKTSVYNIIRTKDGLGSYYENRKKKKNNE
jgi:seryl-tRNA(Sec) selenium transferase